jgi:hypothetical protein
MSMYPIVSSVMGLILLTFLKPILIYKLKYLLGRQPALMILFVVTLMETLQMLTTITTTCLETALLE